MAERILDLGAWLARHKDHGAQLGLTRAQAQALQLELSRLQQSNGLLRKQNKHLRARLGLAADESAGAVDREPGEDPLPDV